MFESLKGFSYNSLPNAAMPVPHLRRTSQASEFDPSYPFVIHPIHSKHFNMAINMATNANLGRSSMEDSPASGEDEVVEPEQGNGASKPSIPPRHTTDLICLGSSFTYHFSATAWRRPESGRLADIHPRASVYARADHQVRSHPSKQGAWSYLIFRYID